MATTPHLLLLLQLRQRGHRVHEVLRVLAQQLVGIKRALLRACRRLLVDLLHSSAVALQLGLHLLSNLRAESIRTHHALRYAPHTC